MEKLEFFGDLLNGEGVGRREEGEREREREAVAQVRNTSTIC